MFWNCSGIFFKILAATLILISPFSFLFFSFFSPDCPIFMLISLDLIVFPNG